MKAKQYKNILVTGCGGDIACSIGKILKKEKYGKKIIGCDGNPDNVGEFIFDKIEKVPFASERNYTFKLKKIIKYNKIDLLIPMSEDEIKFLSRSKKHKEFRTDIAMLSDEILEIGFDKYKTNQFLKDNNFICPWSEIVLNNYPKKYPCFAKSRFGRGSKEIFLVKNRSDADYIIRNKKDYIWQQYLPNNEREYTCGVYRSFINPQNIRTIIIRRTLAGGFTSFGEVVYNAKIETLLKSLAIKIKLQGSMNVQLRLEHDMPYIFEINPRFSSTVYFRHILGFQDLIWYLLEKKGESLPIYHSPKKGVKFYRGITEYFSLDNNKK